MNTLKKIRHPSPALVVALLALFVALTGTAVAGSGLVPLAKRALTADNATKLGGKSESAVVQEAASQPGPASSAAGLVSQKTVSDSIGAKGMKMLSVSCDGGKKVTGAGWSSDGVVFDLGNHPTGDGTWTFEFANFDDSATAAVSAYIVCVG